MDYKDCKFNSSKASSFVGYCLLPKYKTDKGRLFVECGKCPCQDFEVRMMKNE